MRTKRANIPPTTIAIKIFNDFLKDQIIDKKPKIKIIKLTTYPEMISKNLLSPAIKKIKNKIRNNTTILIPISSRRNFLVLKFIKLKF